MTFARRTAPLLIALTATAPAAAQTVPAKPAVSPPPAWSVSADEARGTVEIAATAQDGVSRLVLRCSRSGGVEAGLRGAFSGYRGTGLRTDGEIEPAAFYAGGDGWRDMFSLRLRYAATSRSWQLAVPLSHIFLASFSRGATLSVANARNQEIFVFDLTGSTAATRAMRTVCGLPAQ